MGAQALRTHDELVATVGNGTPQPQHMSQLHRLTAPLKSQVLHPEV